MGRLTLNMLLSFAQFEREVTAERIRDKIAASKAKGMWMGGTPPLGYRPDGRTLAIVEEHAEVVRDIFRAYLDTGNVRQVAEHFARRGITVPRRTRANGDTIGGRAFTRGQLHHVLKSPVYVGEIAHGDKRYKGQQPAIIDRDTWDRTRAMLAGNVQGTRAGTAARPSLLAGKVVDDRGQPLVAAHACKGDKRYRYYVGRDGHHGTGTTPPLRVPAREIEGLVRAQVATLFDDPVALLESAGLDATPVLMATLDEKCRALAATIRGKTNIELIALLAEVRIGKNGIEVDVACKEIARLLGADGDMEQQVITLGSNARLTRTGMVVRLVQQDGQAATPSPPDRSLLKLVVQARRWWATLREGEVNITTLADREGITASWLTRVLRLAFLSPPVVEAITGGTLPPRFDGLAMTRPGAVQASWSEQDAQYLG